MFKKIRNILVITGVRIGDQIMATPFFRALRKRFCEARIVLASGFPAIDILKNNPNIDEFVIIDRNIIPKIIQRGRFDAAIDLCGASDTAYLTVISGARYRIGNRYVGLPDTKPELYTKAVGRLKNNLSFLDRYLFLAEKIGLEPQGRKTEIFLAKDELKKAKNIFEDKGLNKKDFVVGVFPSGSRRRILWQPQKYGRLADKIVDECKVKILFFYDKNERRDLKQVIRVMKNRYYLSGIHNIRIIAGLISLCDCVIVPNRGPMHIVAALGVPTIAIFGPYSEKEFFPYPVRNNLIITKGLDCQPCGMGYKRCKRNIKCLKSLTVDEVYKKIVPFLKRLKK